MLVDSESLVIIQRIYVFPSAHHLPIITEILTLEDVYFFVLKEATHKTILGNANNSAHLMNLQTI